MRIKPEQLPHHHTKGALFENMIIADLHKSYYNRDIVPSLYFWRNYTGHEIDCIPDEGTTLIPIEIKRGITIIVKVFLKILCFEMS